MAIRREITVTRKGLNSPIDIVHETSLLPFEFVVTDFDIPSASIAVVYVESASGNVKKQLCEINDNVISFNPEATLFDEGKNILQLRVTHDEKNLFSFSETVNCSGKIVTGDEEETASQPTLVTQLLTNVANANEKMDNALQEVEDTKQAFEKKVDESVAQLSNPNLFINGNFQIWSNGEEFSIGINEDGTYGGYQITADRWTVGASGSNTAYVYKTDKGLTFAREQVEPIDVFQVLDEETLRTIIGKPLTMSYATITNSTNEYQEHTRDVLMDENIEMDPFAIAEEYFSIELEMGYTLCWAKLEVGEIATPCIPDSKDAIICKLEYESEKQLKIQRNLIVQGNTTGIYSHKDLKHANGLIVLCMAPNLSSYFTCQPILLPNVGHHFIFDKNGEMYTACIQWNKDEGIVKCMNRDDIYIHTISALF